MLDKLCKDDLIGIIGGGGGGDAIVYTNMPCAGKSSLADRTF